MHHWTVCRQTGVSQLPTTPPCRPQKWRLHALATASQERDTTGFLLKLLSSRWAKLRTHTVVTSIDVGGCGTVFKLAPASGGGAWTETALENCPYESNFLYN